ncbi:hypothetical protein [Bacillus sp. TE8-1]|uniref:hypothetical protein n=1 Tax=Bacillus sp. TE8-1 TaxID=2217829 RepID=UPI0011EF5CCD|nr:hypothetical protein [Bacillus sp. TE8-1]KAA0780890.1 hypothetical protein DN404_00130 [Bacillus sp. TE8-1]
MPGMMNGVSVLVWSFAKELRLKIWKEHLGLTNTSTIEDPILGLGQWPDQATSNPAAPNQRFHTVVHHIRFPSIDEVSLRRELLKFLELSFFHLPDLVPLPMGPLSDVFLAGLLPKPEETIRDYIMNVESKC